MLLKTIKKEKGDTQYTKYVFKEWDLIKKAEVTEEYIIIKTVSKQVFFIIKISEINDDRFIPFLKEKLGNNIVKKSQR